MQVGDFCQVRAFSFNVNQLGVNVLHYKCTATSGVYTDQNLADAISTQLSGRYKPLFSQGVSYKGIILNLWPITPTSVQVPSTAGNGVGTAGAFDQLPPFVAGVLTKRTSGRGRSFRGRVFTPFPTENANDVTGLPTAAYRTSMNNLGVDVMQMALVPAVGASITLSGQLWRRSAGAFQDLTSCLASSKWGLMHKRSDFGKTNISPI